MRPRRKSSVEVKRIEEVSGDQLLKSSTATVRKRDVPPSDHEVAQHRGRVASATVALSPEHCAHPAAPETTDAEMAGHEEPLTLVATPPRPEEHKDYGAVKAHDSDHGIQFELPEETLSAADWGNCGQPTFTNDNPPEGKTTALPRVATDISTKNFGTSLMPSPSPSTSASASLSLHTDDDGDAEDFDDDDDNDDEDEEEEEERNGRRPYEMTRRRASEDPMGDEGTDSFSYMPLAKRHAMRLHGRTRSASSVAGDAALQQAAMLSSLGSLNNSTRRQAHIVSEQKRRQSINEGFEDLRKVVPACTNQGDSKAIVLRKAVTYISQLHAEMNRIKTGSSAGAATNSNSTYGGSLPIASHSSSVAPPGPGGRYYATVASPVPSASPHSVGHAISVAMSSPHHSYLGHYSHHNPPPPQYPPPPSTVNGTSTSVISSPSNLSAATAASSAISGSGRPLAAAYPTLPLPAAGFTRTTSPPLTAVHGPIGASIKLPSATSLPHFSTTPAMGTPGHPGSRTMPPAPAGYYATVMQHHPPLPAQAPQQHSQPQSAGAQPCYSSGASVYNRDDYLSAASLSMLRQLDTSR